MIIARDHADDYQLLHSVLKRHGVKSNFHTLTSALTTDYISEIPGMSTHLSRI